MFPCSTSTERQSNNENKQRIEKEMFKMLVTKGDEFIMQFPKYFVSPFIKLS